MTTPDNTRHGHSRRGAKTRTYIAWEAMHRRCSNPSQESYPQYGGRGIAVCPEWRDFAAFLRDMGECPDGLTLERKCRDSDYSPSNCRWATQKEQQRNRRGNRLLTHMGMTLTAAEWSERTGIQSAVIRSRIDRHGWSVAKALDTPTMTTQQVMQAAHAKRWAPTASVSTGPLHRPPAEGVA